MMRARWMITGVAVFVLASLNTYGNSMLLSGTPVLNAVLVYADDVLQDDANSNPCDDASPDEDGDGLTQCQEAHYGTSDRAIDSDDDGMTDGFEVTYGLDPRANDGDLDSDGDEMTHLEEFLANSDPTDSASPYSVYFVSPEGSDESGDGTATTPWRTIAFALNAMNPPAESPAKLILNDGVYAGSLLLREETVVRGARDAHVEIVGPLTGANGATLTDLSLRQGTESTIILDMDNVVMTLEYVHFLGTAERDGTGILMDGPAPFDSVLAGCTFERLGVGLDIGGAIPTMRRCTFDNFPVSFGPDALPGAAIYIREYDGENDGSRNIGDSSNPDNGWNDFLPSIEGLAVINEREEVVTMQDNYWGVTDPSLFPTRVRGAASVLPILLKRSSILASTIFCTVWDEEGQARMKSAGVGLHVSAFNEVVENSDGVYAFACVDNGEYDVVVRAAGYQDVQTRVSIGAGELKSLNIAMRPLSSAGDGAHSEAAGVEVPGCNAARTTIVAGAKAHRGDAFLMALSMVTLLVFGRFSHRR